MSGKTTLTKKTYIQNSKSGKSFCPFTRSACNERCMLNVSVYFTKENTDFEYETRNCAIAVIAGSRAADFDYKTEGCGQ
jgi:hypothetical protein